MISEWLVKNGKTFAAMPMAGMEPNYFTINGKAFPDTETITVKKGAARSSASDRDRAVRSPHPLAWGSIQNRGNGWSPGPRSSPTDQRYCLVSPGERYDIEFVATETGQWMLHCHILHHTTNDNVEPGGLMLMINVTD